MNAKFETYYPGWVGVGLGVGMIRLKTIPVQSIEIGLTVTELGKSINWISDFFLKFPLDYLFSLVSLGSLHII